MIFSWNNSRIKEPKVKTNAKDSINYLTRASLLLNSSKRKLGNSSPLTVNLKTSSIKLKRIMKDFLKNWRPNKLLFPPPTERSSNWVMKKVNWKRRYAKLKESVRRVKDNIRIFAKPLIMPPTRTKIWQPNSRTLTLQLESMRVSLTNQL